MSITLIGCNLKSRESREENLHGVGAWLSFQGKLSPVQGEMKAAESSRELGLKIASGKVLPPEDYRRLVELTAKKVGSEDSAKHYVMSLLGRYGMGFVTSRGILVWAPSVISGDSFVGRGRGGGGGGRGGRGGRGFGGRGGRGGRHHHGGRRWGGGWGDGYVLWAPEYEIEDYIDEIETQSDEDEEDSKDASR